MFYIAKLIFHIDINHGEKSGQFDQSIRLIEAGSAIEALAKARQVGNAEACSFVNINNNIVEWKFIDACEIRAIEELKTGTELYASTYIEENHREYIRHVKLNARAIEKAHLFLS